MAAERASLARVGECSMGRLLAWCAALFLMAGMLTTTAAHAEDGYDLWLRYRPLPADIQARDRTRAASIVVAGDGSDPSVAKAAEELERALSGMLGGTVSAGAGVKAGSVVIGTAK